MDKVKINEQIILMRKNMKVAKVYAIRKILKQIKLLQKKINKRENDKIQRKIERLKKEVDTIRKLNIDKVTNLALKEEKQWNKILIQKDASIEERSFARLISHKKIQENISQFHNKNPELQTFIPSVLEKWEKRRLLKQEKTKNEQNENNMGILNQNKHQKDNLQNSEKEDQEEELAESNELPDLFSKKLIKKKSISIKKNIIKSSNEDSVEDIVMETIKNIPTRQLCKEIEKIPDKIEGSMHIQQINLDTLKDDDNIDINPITEENILKPFLSEKKSRDSFFSNGNDSEPDYQSDNDSNFVSDDEYSQTETSNVKTPKMKTQFVSSLSSNNKRGFPGKNRPKSFSQQDFKKRIPRKSEKILRENMWESKQNNKNTENTPSFKRSKRGDSDQDSNLHPSWEAKKKQQMNILPFQGKKIKFDDDD